MIYSTYSKLYKKSWQPLLGCLLMLVVTTLSCRRENEMELNKGNAPLALSVNKNVVVLNEKDGANDGIVFTWTTGSNHGTSAGISYVLKIDKQGNNFQNAVVDTLGKANLTMKYSVQELNDLLLNHWKLEPGKEAVLEAKVIATVHSDPVTIDSTGSTSFKVTPYQPVTANLYLLGDATPNGWSADNATALKGSTVSPGVFTWQGMLTVGDFKFITKLGQFLPSYNKGIDNSHLTYRISDNQPDNKFHVDSVGNYSITVSLLDSSITISAANTPPYSNLWIVGDATPNGWNIDNPNKLRVDSSNLFVFSYNEVLKAGEFKFPTATGNWGGDFYMPLTNYQDLSLTGMQLVRGGSPDLKWKITTPGAYKIKLDLQTMTINIKPFTPYTQIWMVGDATPVGWNINSPQPMTPDATDPYVFSFTGHMNAGEFKFPLATGDWGCDYFMPVINGAGVGSTQMKFVASGNPDFKWKITEAGNYKITINQLYETISIEKQ
jgi:hypothetical protein